MANCLLFAITFSSALPPPAEFGYVKRNMSGLRGLWFASDWDFIRRCLPHILRRRVPWSESRRRHDAFIQLISWFRGRVGSNPVQCAQRFIAVLVPIFVSLFFPFSICIWRCRLGIPFACPIFIKRTIRTQCSPLLPSHRHLHAKYAQTTNWVCIFASPRSISRRITFPCQSHGTDNRQRCDNSHTYYRVTQLWKHTSDSIADMYCCFVCEKNSNYLPKPFAHARVISFLFCCSPHIFCADRMCEHTAHTAQQTVRTEKNPRSKTPNNNWENPSKECDITAANITTQSARQYKLRAFTHCLTHPVMPPVAASRRRTTISIR